MRIGDGRPLINFNGLLICGNYQSRDRLNNSPSKSIQGHQVMKYLHIKFEHDNGIEHSYVINSMNYSSS